MQEEVKPQRQSQVSEQLNNLEKGLVSLHEVINTLVARLEPVLRTELPSEECTGKDKNEVVPLASTLESHADSAKAARSKIDDILDRLEL